MDRYYYNEYTNNNLINKVLIEFFALLLTCTVGMVFGLMFVPPQFAFIAGIGSFIVLLIAAITKRREFKPLSRLNCFSVAFSDGNKLVPYTHVLLVVNGFVHGAGISWDNHGYIRWIGIVFITVQEGFHIPWRHIVCRSDCSDINKSSRIFHQNRYISSRHSMAWHIDIQWLCTPRYFSYQEQTIHGSRRTSNCSKPVP